MVGNTKIFVRSAGWGGPSCGISPVSEEKFRFDGILRCKQPQLFEPLSSDVGAADARDLSIFSGPINECAAESTNVLLPVCEVEERLKVDEETVRRLL